MRAAILLLLTGLLARAGDLVVIVNPASGVERLRREEVVNLFLGRTRQLPSGLPALPLDQGPEAPNRARFYRDLVSKELPDINAYWARLLFSGQATPPRQIASEADLLDFVRTHPGAIAYVDRAKADRRVRIVFEFSP